MHAELRKFIHLIFFFFCDFSFVEAVYTEKIAIFRRSKHFKMYGQLLLFFTINFLDCNSNSVQITNYVDFDVLWFVVYMRRNYSLIYNIFPGKLQNVTPYSDAGSANGALQWNEWEMKPIKNCNHLHWK